MFDFINPLVLALLANLSFSYASVHFGVFSKALGPLWMNTVKGYISWFCFLLTVLFMGGLGKIQWSLGEGYLFISGLIGLGIGDIFLLRGYATIGAARSIILFSFQPLIFLSLEWILGTGDINTEHIISVVLFILCIYIFASEKTSSNKNWHGVGYALVGVFLDGLGLILTKKGFEFTGHSTELANMIRNFGAVLILSLVCYLRGLNVLKIFNGLLRAEKLKVTGFSVLGTYLSLLFYLGAIKSAMLSEVTAIAITGPIFASLFERLIEKKKFSPRLLISLVLFIFTFLLKLF